jgi:PAT family beta-lactamase induction signal transducer AmpG
MPLALVWIAIPDWLAKSGFDIRIVGLTTLAHAPWIFKTIWSPLMDGYPLPWLGRRRGWIAVCQIALLGLTLLLAGAGDRPETPWVILALALAIAFASASQDIVIDAYAVDVLRREEHGVAVGARTAVYRAAMFVAGGLAITLASRLSWPVVNAGLALLYLPMLFVTRRAPEPALKFPPPTGMREAVWLPFLGFLGRHRALEILAFVILYKFADSLAQSMQRPFLVEMGYSDFDRGVALATIGLAGTIVGTFIGGVSTTVIGLGHALWIFGLLQIFSNFGFILVSQSAVNRPLMYGALGFEAVTTGLGMGAFGVLLLRLTQKRFSATQYALFSSLFGLPRVIAGPITGITVHSIGWTAFFWLTLLAGLPGLLLLARFVPPGTREPAFAEAPRRRGSPPPKRELIARALLGGVATWVAAMLLVALLSALGGLGPDGSGRFDFPAALAAMLSPASLPDAFRLAGALLLGVLGGLLTAAVAAARCMEHEDDE